MTGPQFPDYSIKYSQTAVETRKKLSADMLTLLDDIVYDLSVDPDKHPERLIPVSREGGGNSLPSSGTGFADYQRIERGNSQLDQFLVPTLLIS